MSFRVTLDGPEASQNALTDLLTWIRNERLEGVSAERAADEPRAGDLGALNDALQVLAAPGVAPAVAGCIVAWIKERGRAVRVTITSASGRSCILDAQSPEDAIALSEGLRDPTADDPTADDPTASESSESERDQGSIDGD